MTTKRNILCRRRRRLVRASPYDLEVVQRSTPTDTMLIFDGHGDGNVTCKQTLSQDDKERRRKGIRGIIISLVFNAYHIIQYTEANYSDNIKHFKDILWTLHFYLSSFIVTDLLMIQPRF